MVVGAKKFFIKDTMIQMDIDCTDHENPKQHLKVPYRHELSSSSRSQAIYKELIYD